MIIDSNSVLLDNVAVLGIVVTGPAVPLTSLHRPGREEPIPICVRVVEDFTGAPSLTLKLTQADSQDGTYTDVPGSPITMYLAGLKTGKPLGWRFIPRGVTKPWLKLVVSPGGTFSAGKLFAAIVREDELPYEDGMYIDKGSLVG